MWHIPNIGYYAMLSIANKKYKKCRVVRKHKHNEHQPYISTDMKVVVACVLITYIFDV